MQDDAASPSTLVVERSDAAREEEEEQSTVDKEVSPSSVEDLSKLLNTEVARRRNFAIISHPDAGKTTLVSRPSLSRQTALIGCWTSHLRSMCHCATMQTEKLLLFGGAIQEAGEVKARRAAKHATSDWMELEKQRGERLLRLCLAFMSAM